jgi:hypothetical protein
MSETRIEEIRRIVGDRDVYGDYPYMDYHLEDLARMVRVVLAALDEERQKGVSDE